MPPMYLVARVPNQGAHRLAWVIGQKPDPAAAIAEIEAKIGVNMIDRLLTGSLTPSARMGAQLWSWSDGQLVARDFYRDADRGWAVPPEPRAVARVLALAA